ncbi:MAG TPA: glycosyltransferase family 4 protein, partial [Candidatus Thermoplasmatota archaeon]|nr:glycosyltransferase family 4 protein [Candidatus Thermoplasmatota archaeon]
GRIADGRGALRVVLAAIRYPPAPGGAESHVAALAEGFARRGHDVVVHASDLHTEYPFRRDPSLPDKVNGVRVVRHPARRWLGAWTAMPTMPRALLRDARGADVLHAHSYGYYQTVAAAWAARRAGVPFVFTPHFHPPWSMEGGALRRRLRGVFDATLGRHVLRRADRVVMVSSGELDEMRRHLPVEAREVRVVPNGFHADRFDPAPDGAAFRARVGVEGPLVLFAGRLASNKGLHHLVRAMPRFPGTVVLTGQDQGLGPELRRQADALGVGARLKLAGHLDDATYRSALAAADVLVLPSEWEAFGIVLAEAMACGTPVVATRVGGAPDVVGAEEGGLLVPYGDADALADALRRVLKDDALARRLGEAGRARALREFTWDAVVERTLAVYGELKKR